MQLASLSVRLIFLSVYTRVQVSWSRTPRRDARNSSIYPPSTADLSRLECHVVRKVDVREVVHAVLLSSLQIREA